MGESEGGDVPAKKSRNLCKYLKKWDSEFPFLKRSQMGLNHAFCKVCNCDFSVAHGGRNDVTHHETSNKHRRWLEAQKRPQEAPALVPANITVAEQAINAEVKMAMLCAQHNVSFTVCDEFKRCVADIFPDSAIARKYSEGATSSSQLIKGAIAAELGYELAKACRSRAFPLMSDSGKTGKELVALSRLYDEAALEVPTRFTEVPVCDEGNNPEELSEALSYTCVLSRLKSSQPHLQDHGAVCHLAQQAADCAIRALQIPVEDILVGIYTHFFESAIRCEVHKDFVDFTDRDHLMLLGHCSTSWLSLLTCMQRVFNQWDALQDYFHSHELLDGSTKMHDLASHLRDPVLKVYFLFLTVALKPLSEFSIAFQQSEELQSQRLEEEMHKLIRIMLSYIIPVRGMVGVPVRDVEYGEGHQLADEDLFLGEATKALMRSVALPVSAENEILQSVRRFYEAALQQIVSSFPIDPAACLVGATGTG